MKSALTLAVLVSLALPSQAQDNPLPLRAESEQLVLDALGQQLVLPPPDWSELSGTAPEALLEAVSTHFREGDDQARLEIYPRGEGEALWSRLYGAQVFRQPSMTLVNLRSVIVDVYTRPCRPDTVALFQLEPDDGDAIPPLGLVCGAYRDLPGYQGKGEVMLMGFYKSSAGVALVYQEWRGDAFDPADPQSWPVSSDEIQQRVGQFKSATSLTPVD